jgi:hypothetical protein
MKAGWTEPTGGDTLLPTPVLGLTCWSLTGGECPWQLVRVVGEQRGKRDSLLLHVHLDPEQVSIHTLPCACHQRPLHVRDRCLPQCGNLLLL